jgi:putative peptidoglycan lipid II flippase
VLLISRVAPIILAAIVTAKIGCNAESDRFWLAFQLPLLIAAIASGITASFSDRFSEYLHTRREDQAWALAKIVFGAVLTFAAVITLASVFFGAPIAHMLAPGKSTADTVLIGELLAPLVIAQSLLVLQALLQGVMYAQGRRFTPGLTQVLYYLGLSFGLLASGFKGVCWGGVVGASAALLSTLWGYKGTVLHFRGRASAELSADLAKSAFFSLAYSFPLLGLVLLHFFASYLSAGSNSVVELSYCLILPAIAVFGIALGSSVSPAVAHLLGQDRPEMVKKQLESSIGVCLYMSIPAAAILWGVAGPTIRTVYLRLHHIDPAYEQIRSNLMALALAIPALCLFALLSRSAMVGQFRRATTFSALISLALFALAWFASGGQSLLILTSIFSGSATLGALLLLTLVSRQYHVDGKRLLISFSGMLLSSVVIGFGLYLLVTWTNLNIPISVIPLLLFFPWIYYYLTVLLKIPERTLVANALTRKPEPKEAER